MVTAIDPNVIDLKDNEIAITDWLAEDLGVKKGDLLTLTYFVSGDARKLTEQTSEFTIKEILPMNDPRVNKSWSPEFPGFTEAEMLGSNAEDNLITGLS